MDCDEPWKGMENVFTVIHIFELIGMLWTTLALKHQTHAHSHPSWNLQLKKLELPLFFVLDKVEDVSMWEAFSMVFHKK